MTTKVLISRGFGAGWSTWNGLETPDVATDAGLVALIEAGDTVKAHEYAEKKWPNAYLGGLSDCEVQEVPTGTLYQVREYDGSESLVTFDDICWKVG